MELRLHIFYIYIVWIKNIFSVDQESGYGSYYYLILYENENLFFNKFWISRAVKLNLYPDLLGREGI